MKLAPPSYLSGLMGRIRSLSDKLRVVTVGGREQWGPEGPWKKLVQAQDELAIFHALLRPGWWFDHQGLAQVGADLAECPGWERTNLLRRLRDPNAHGPARFEAGVWAGLRRVGSNFRRVPEAAVRTADFEGSEGRKTFALELKAVGAAVYHRNVSALSEAISQFDWFPLVRGGDEAQTPKLPSYSLRFLPDDTVQSRLSNTDPDQFAEVYVPRIMEFFRQWFRERGASLAPGMTGVIPNIGSFEIGPPPAADQTSWMVVEIDEPTVFDEYRRILVSAISARGQVERTAADVRVALLWISWWHTPLEEARIFVPQLVAGAPHEFQHLDWLLLMNVHRVSIGESVPEVAALRLLGTERLPPPDITSMNWYRGLTSWRNL